MYTVEQQGPGSMTMYACVGAVEVGVWLAANESSISLQLINHAVNQRAGF